MIIKGPPTLVNDTDNELLVKPDACTASRAHVWVTAEALQLKKISIAAAFNAHKNPINF